MTIVGYYHANERQSDGELGHVARKIGERLQSRFNPAVVVLVNNAMKPTADKLALTVYSLVGSVWTPTSAVKLEGAEQSLQALAKQLASGAQHALNDFDSHLDDAARPWLDQKLALV